MTGALRCKQEGCDGYVLSAAPLDKDSEWHCKNCDAATDSQKVAETVSKLMTEAASLNESVEDKLSLLERAGNVLHPNHSLLTEIRWKTIPSFTLEMSEEYFGKRKQLCIDNLAVMNIVDPGKSSSRAKTLYYLHLSSFMLGQHLFLADKISRDDFTKIVHDCISTLTEASSCLRDEVDDSLEKKMADSITLSMLTIKDIYLQLLNHQKQ